MVDAITQARDAEKAMEEAKQAATRAKVSYLQTQKSVLEVARLLEDWEQRHI